ncbi:MAG TPA: site-2 protease family protein, partial [Phycisphaerae bacterium]|nr:site-2 protease family protein [Phycisphaerae bacterium]
MAVSIAGLFADWIWPVLGFVAGLGLVIFVHELGHFLVAKAVGIKVERFALGFGPRLLGFVRNETDYCVNLLPLGGYVKMLGQEDFKPLEGEQADPRAFYNKSVGARLAVISAGVVMNVILAAVLFVIVCLVGKSFAAPVVGSVRPGWPAASAKILWQDAAGDEPATRPAESIGLQPGDKILEVNGAPITRFMAIAIEAALAGRDETFTFKIERDVEGAKRIGEARLAVKPTSGSRDLVFGITSAADTLLHMSDDITAPTPFRNGDRVVEIAGRKVAHHWDIREIAKSLDGSPVTVKVLRRKKSTEEVLPLEILPALRSSMRTLYRKDGTRIRGDVIETEEETRKVLPDDGDEQKFEKDQITVAGHDEILDLVGMVPRFRIGGIIEDSPAEKAGLQFGDIVLSYADRSTPTRRQFQKLNKEFVGKETNLVVLRDGKTKTIKVVPKRLNKVPLVGVQPSVDLMHPVVAAVREGSPAQRAGIPPGAEITGITAADTETGQKTARPVTTWTEVYQVLKEFRGREIGITYQLGVQQRTAEIGRLDEAAFDPADYEFDLFRGHENFEFLKVTVIKRNPLHAIAWGVGETGRFVAISYLSLRSLIRGTVSGKGVMGPVG